MKAWQKHFPFKTAILVDIPVPSVAPDGLLVKTHAAGVCHSDFAILNNTARPENWPSDKFTLGHEGAGKVVEVGSSVTDFQVGDMVAILSVPGCGSATCRECCGGLWQICQKGERYGLGHDGSYAEYVAIKSRAALKLPKGVPAEVGAVATDACLTAYHAVVGTARVTADETVAIIGLGGLGFNALQIVQSIGARVIVADKRQEVLDEAVKFRVPTVDVVPVGQSLVDFIHAQGVVIDTILDFVGVQETFRASQEAVRYGGKLVQVGLLAPEISINNFLAVRKHLSILCSYGGTMGDLQACLDLVARAKLRPQVELGKMSDFARIMEDLHAGKIKSRIALEPNF